MPRNIKPQIDYTSRDYTSIRDELQRFAKRYYPDTYKDFNDASFGSLVLDMVSYIGDQLSFYMDFQANESFISTAMQRENVHRHAQDLGWNGVSAQPSAAGMCDFYVRVPGKATGLGPDLKYIPTLLANSTVSLAGQSFILTQDVDFSNSANEVVVANTNAATGVPTSYAIKATGPIISGQFTRTNISTAGFQKFKRITIDDPDLAEIISVQDSSGNYYYQVESLDQNTIYLPIKNHQAATDSDPKRILRPFVVPRRFILRRKINGRSQAAKYELIFGYGSSSRSITVAEPGKTTMNLYGKEYISDTSFAPEQLLKTDKFGICPENTTLTIVYRKNANISNIGLSAQGKILNAKYYFKETQNLSPGKIAAVKASVECTNSEQIITSKRSEGMSDIKAHAASIFSRQKRAVTMQDYQALVYYMEPRFGSVYRCSIMQDSDSFKRNLNLYVLSTDNKGKFITTPAVTKNNLKTWINEFKMINDTIDIMDAKVVNLAVEFNVSIAPTEDKTKVHRKCVAAISRIMSIKYEIGQDFPIGQCYRSLGQVNGVIDVKSVRIKRAIGARYSDIRFNIEENTSADSQFLVAPKNVAFEIKYPSLDITGVIS
jgi:hypothetical protein